MKVPFKDLFQGNQKVIGTWDNGNSNVTPLEHKGISGFQFVIIDDELGCQSNPDPMHLVIAAENRNMAPIFRVRRWNSDESIQKYLDIGASGILVPNIRTKEMVEHVMECVSYPPEGRRGFCTVIRGNDYGMKYGVDEFFNKTKEELTVMLLMEEKQAVENIEAICSVPGVNAFFIGRMDLALSYGIPGNYGDTNFFKNPVLIDAISTIIEVGHKHNIKVGMDMFDTNDIETWAPKLDFIAYGATDMNDRQARNYIEYFHKTFRY